MPNNYFKFKQFTIQQDKCAMKVCTDCCLFGALVSNHMELTSTSKKDMHCLDIGTGTGLLSLMAAQKNDGIEIDAVEIDKPAAAQAASNVAASPWANRIKVIQEDILNIVPDKPYDWIFSNPPFFEDDLRSAVAAKNKAKHDISLSLLQIIELAGNTLSETGFFAVLLPYKRVEYFIETSKKYGLHLTRQVLVKQSPKHKFFRGILFFQRKANEPVLEEITIKDTENKYTPEIAEALKDYYLFL